MNAGASMRERGFSLIEILAVVAILALLSALVLPNLGLRASSALRDQAERIVAELELARQRSIATRIPHRMWIDLDAGATRVEWLVTEAAALGQPEPAAPAELDLRADAPLPLSPPRAASREFYPLPSALGRLAWLPDDAAFARVETAESWVVRGGVSVTFAADGTTESTAIVLESDGGARLRLEVAPLADAVWIVDETG